MNGLHFTRVIPQTFESAVRSFVLSPSSAVVRSDLMQLWESEFVYVPKCLHCHGRPRMHRHGKCKRTGSDGLPTMLQRYRCPLCLRTCSIFKDMMLPYRRVSAERLQSCLDNPQELQVEPDSKPVRSAVKRFQQRTRRIVMVLGALLRLPLGLTASLPAFRSVAPKTPLSSQASKIATCRSFSHATRLVLRSARKVVSR